MTAKDWTGLFKKYKGQWVALDEDEITVLAHHKLVANVIKETAKKGQTAPILFKVPNKPMLYIGSV